ncbi:MAG: Fe-S protein assembly co-chaperone HscB [Alphaproteobacteria bacterium]
MQKIVAAVVNHLMYDNYFSIFGLPIKYDLDYDILNKKYFELLKNFHPDNSINSTNEEKLQTTKASMLINDAYQTLKDPLKRIEYLLKLQNINITEDGQVKASFELLNDIMEYREELEEAQDKSVFEKLENKAYSQIEDSKENFQKYYNSQQFEQATESAIKLKYYQKLFEDIKAKKLYK